MILSKTFKVSVIIPVYNAELFLERAVKSCLNIPTVKEIILVEDNSEDNSLMVCKRLSNNYEIVKLFRHSHGMNLGAGATRTLGIKSASNPYIAFLDADDFYDEKRFVKTYEVFNENPDAEGVYECLGIHFEDQEAKNAWFKTRNDIKTTITKQVTPENLLPTLLKGKSGSIHLNTLTVMKKVFQKTGYFSDHRIAQDTLLIHKLAATCKMYPGSIDNPVAYRGVHHHNRITRSKQDNLYHEISVLENFEEWYKKINHHSTNLRLLKKKIFNRKIDYSKELNTKDKRSYLQALSSSIDLSIIFSKFFVKWILFMLK